MLHIVPRISVIVRYLLGLHVSETVDVRERVKIKYCSVNGLELS